MKLFIFVALVLAAFINVSIAANVIHFYNTDAQPRQICWSPQAGYKGIKNTYLAPWSHDIRVELDQVGWRGSFKAVNSGGNCDDKHVISEVVLQGWEGVTWFAVSAIDNRLDNSGIRFLWPTRSHEPSSGCWTFPCDNVWNYAPPKDQGKTRVTGETELDCNVGNPW